MKGDKTTSWLATTGAILENMESKSNLVGAMVEGTMAWQGGICSSGGSDIYARLFSVHSVTSLSPICLLLGEVDGVAFVDE